MKNWIDAHTHLDADELYPQRIEILNRAAEAGVRKVLLVNSEASANSFLRTLDVARLMPGTPEKFVSLGIHPHHASMYSEDLENLLLQALAIIRRDCGGRNWFRLFLQLFASSSPNGYFETSIATQLEKSKTRCDSLQGRLSGTCEILRSESDQWNGMIHCFTGNSKRCAIVSPTRLSYFLFRHRNIS